MHDVSAHRCFSASQLLTPSKHFHTSDDITLTPSKPRKAPLITTQHTKPVATSSVSPVDADPVIPSINIYGTFDPSGHSLRPHSAI